MDIKFNVSAKTARLIGRENIADVDGAVIELVKNAYDADASCCLVKFNIPFPNINLTYKKSLIKSFLKQDEYESLLEYCIEKNESILKKDNLTIEQESEMEKILFAHNSIIIVDNGIGMTKNILENAWMNIGTDNKEKNYSSEKGRVKTGAKGIGRFALDKLSTATLVYTKNKKDELYKWDLDWEDFDHAKLLSEVTAHLNIEDHNTLKDVVYENFAEQKDLLDLYSWESGTIIVLSPLREQWNERLFKKVINNMRSLNPLNSVDLFDVHLFNTFFQQYSAKQESAEIKRKDYDYKLSLNYDGDDRISLLLDRNEIDVDLDKIKVISENKDKTYELNLHSFWNREKFKISNYERDDYDNQISFEYKVKDFLGDSDDAVNFKKIGNFSFEMLFLKADNSTLEIVKDIPVRSRKKILDLHSGIKIYRDNFKVRPYGDEGSLYDWLNLGKRSQLSPAAVTHQSGNWRVEPYQVIGSLSISRLGNPRLEDMANREAIALNDSYYLLVDFLKKAIEKFEFDRQYVLREFAAWKKEELDKLEPIKEKIIQTAKKKKKNKDNNESSEKFTSDQYEEVINDLSSEKSNDINAQQLLMMFSSSGIMANTFSHELQRISTDLGSRAQQLRSSIKKLVKPEEYCGDPDYNPYPILDRYQKTDELLSSWIRVIMDGIQGNVLEKNEIDLTGSILSIIEKWKPLLRTKHINIEYEPGEKIKYQLSLADIYLILNNFILNSAWFLEKSADRKIIINLEKDEKSVNLTLVNNGEKLDDRYKNNPYQIFEIGETSKYKTNENGDEEKIGTGIGLWIVAQSISKYYAQIEILDNIEGFGFTIKFPRS